tara:strand:- start:248 stop:553 length:306 start_codon:yes stop_codon:yes gene_type:complete
MTISDEELDKKLEELMKKLQKATTKGEQTVLHPIVLKGNGPHFYWSISDKTFLQVPNPSELYVMANKGKKDGKLYVFSPGTWQRGVVYLIPEEIIEYIGEN